MHWVWGKRRELVRIRDIVQVLLGVLIKQRQGKEKAALEAALPQQEGPFSFTAPSAPARGGVQKEPEI